MKLDELLESVRRARSVLVVGLFLLSPLTSRAAGEPTTLAELNAWYPAVPASQNAAMIYADAFGSLPGNSSDPTPALAVSQKPLALLHRAAEFSKCRYPIDLTFGFQTELPHLAKIKETSELLKLEAIANASKGRADLAVQSIQSGLAVARSLEQEPVLISQWVRSRAIDITISALEQSLWKKAFSDQQLIAVQASLKAAETNDTTAYRR
ncbi:MAG TPA: hypothetical protein VK327_11445, partial [Candidatus Paceibacterota bacterium]|nr:hypothetical protein [Candidatus Paceibacterota bacterium]